MFVFQKIYKWKGIKVKYIRDECVGPNRYALVRIMKDDVILLEGYILQFHEGELVQVHPGDLEEI